MAQAELEPVLIYTMGKVGTEAVKFAIENAGLRAYKTHNLFRDRLEERIVRARARNHEPVTDIGALDFVKRVLPGARVVRTVTLVRESVGRNMSGYFQSLWKHNIHPPYSGLSAEHLVRIYFKHVSQERPDRWFKQEFGRAIGVEPFGFAFDPAAGHGRLRSGKFDVLVARIELGNQRLGQLLSDFLGSTVVVGERHRGVEADYGALYAEFKRIIRFPPGFLEGLMKSGVMQHFYTEKQRRHIVRFYQSEIPALHPFPDSHEQAAA